MPTIPPQVMLERIETLSATQLRVLWYFLEYESDRRQALEEYNKIIMSGQEPSEDLRQRAFPIIDEQICEAMPPHKEKQMQPVTVRTHIHDIRVKLGLISKEADSEYMRNMLFFETFNYLKEIKEIVGLLPEREYPKIEDGEPNENFIIYRNLSYNHDWFDDFSRSLELKPPRLGSELLYYGPGLARNWLGISESDFESDRRECFYECLELLTEYLKEPTNLIDLGIGDFKMARTIVKHCLKDNSVTTLNYYPVDISYEMITDSLLNGTESLPNEKEDNFYFLNEVLKQGKIIGINTPFTKLKLYKNIFSEECKNIYLLLGNTIGNEFNPVRTLEIIKESMKEDDILVVEFQLIEDKIRSDNDITKSVNKDPELKKFYKGAFLALGCKDSQIDLSIFGEESEHKSIKYSFVCKFKTTVSCSHFAFNTAIKFEKASSYSVYVVNKFNPQGAMDILDQAGFRILSHEISKFSEPTDRRFLYTVVKRKPK